MIESVPKFVKRARSEAAVQVSCVHESRLPTEPREAESYNLRGVWRVSGGRALLIRRRQLFFAYRFG